MKFYLPLLLLFISCSSAESQRLTDTIHLNQIGFYPDSPKIAVVTDEKPDSFYVMTPDLEHTLYSGQLGPVRETPNSGERVRTADFSNFIETGTYVLWMPGLGYSYQFTVAPNIYEDAAKASLKGFYFQRMSTPISYKYGGEWARPAGHPDTSVVIHPSAATEERPAGSTISSPKGWYDAGDYNKYAVNSGITMSTLFSLYEDFPDYMRTFEVDIPETGNGLPDVLNESLWNLQWYMKMQDPNDGGVYHKLTTADFSGQVMPVEADETRYVIQKSVTGTLNFAAVMAQASRIFEKYDEILPGLADSTLAAAKQAWNWARENPDQLYSQNRMNEQFDPDIETGAYGDRNASDEFIWAAIELFITTGNPEYYQSVDIFPTDEATIPSWRNMKTLGYYSLARLGHELPEKYTGDIEKAQEMIIKLADDLTEGVSETGYRTVMDRDASNYSWGGSSRAANQGISLIQAYLLTEKKTYLEYAHSNIDYLFGRNATGYSFLTGFGFKTPLNIHHRPSRARITRNPVPGLLSGGPNPDQQDGCEYESDLPATSFLDDWCSYASNEIAINWNAPLVYLAAAMEALQYRSGFVTDK